MAQYDDLGNIFGQQDDPNSIAELIKRMAGTDQGAQLAELVRQGMQQQQQLPQQYQQLQQTMQGQAGQGPSTLAEALQQRESRFGAETSGSNTPALSFGADPSHNYTPDELRNIANTIGYAGKSRPVDPNWRPSDVINMTGMKSQQYNDAVDKQAIGSQVVGGRRLDDIIGLLGGLPKGSEDIQAGVLGAFAPGLRLPDTKGAQRREARDVVMQDRRDQREDREQNQRINNIASYYNKKTGVSASEDFIDSVPDKQALQRDYVALKTDQRGDLSALQNLDNDIVQYRELVKKLPIPEGEGLVSSSTSALNLKRLRLQGNEDVRELDALRARLISTARAFGGTSKSADSIREVERLEKAVVTDWDNKKSANAAIDQLETFRDSRARTLPVPGLQNRYGKKATAPEPQVAPQAGPQGQPQRVGTQKGTGKPVYQRPDGSYYTE